MSEAKEARIAIIGAGPAGLAAALQLTRQGRRPLLLEQGQPGGLLRNANWVENYPGFPGGIAGPDLVRHFLEQCDRVGVEITPAEVEQLDLGPEGYVLQTSRGRITAEIVVVASGTKPNRYQSVPLPAAIIDRVHYEVADLLHVKDKEILILGAGDAAFDYALNLGRHNQVTILNRGSRVVGLGLLFERVQAAPSVKYLADHEVVAVDAGAPDRLQISARAEGDIHHFEVDYLIPAIGRQPTKDFLTERVNNHCKRLMSEGKLFFIGDVANDRFRQTAIAVGDGLRVAMEIEARLMGDYE